MEGTDASVDGAAGAEDGAVSATGSEEAALSATETGAVGKPGSGFPHAPTAIAAASRIALRIPPG